MKQVLRSVILLGLMSFSFSVAAVSMGSQAPDFTLKSKSGKNVRLSDYRGQVVMINFWASWCGPCRQEMPLLEKMHRRYSKLGFVLLGVNVEADSSKANAYLKDIPVSFPVLYDTNNKASKLYDVSAMPTTIILDRNGKMRFLHQGYKPGYEKDYKKQVKQLIKE